MQKYVLICQAIDYVKVNGHKLRHPCCIGEAESMIRLWDESTHLGIFDRGYKASEIVRIIESDTIPPCSWGWGAFVVKANGQLEIVRDNYDSSG